MYNVNIFYVFLILFTVITSTTQNNDLPCTYSHSHWINNNKYINTNETIKWPETDPLSYSSTEDNVICTMTWYNLTQINILKMIYPENSVYILMSHAYITSKLNIFKMNEFLLIHPVGGEDEENNTIVYDVDILIPSNVKRSISFIENILVTHCNRMKMLFDNQDNIYSDIYYHIELLNDYNIGRIGPGICNDDINSSNNTVSKEEMRQALQEMSKFYGFVLFFDIFSKNHVILLTLLLLCLFLFLSLMIVIIYGLYRKYGGDGDGGRGQNNCRIKCSCFRCFEYIHMLYNRIKYSSIIEENNTYNVSTDIELENVKIDDDDDDDKNK